MAQITGAQNERVFQIQKWLGLNQNPDGDTKLKYGEAAVMRNWKVTRDGNLQKRPGSRVALHVHDTVEIKEVWVGFVGGTEYIVCLAGTKLFKITPGTPWTKTEIGTIDGLNSNFSKPVHMFGFDGKLYMIAYGIYYKWDGTTFSKVTGYRPLVAVAVPPNGGGELLESVNKLNGLRRCWISPTGNTDKKFYLPLGGTIDDTAGNYAVIKLDTNTTLTAGTDYTLDKNDGSITFANDYTLAEGTNSYEIQWAVSENYYTQVCGMAYSEIFNGSQDTRVFLYGDGSAQAIYSGLDYDGKPTAEYWPDLNQVQVGVANTPITGMIRQLTRLIVFKSDSSWVIQYGNVTDAEGNLIAGFYVTPLNRTIGNIPMGQVQLVLNDPVTLFGKDVYEWKPNSYGNLTADERQAKRISDRVYDHLRTMAAYECKTFDDNYNQEYYIFDEQGHALVWNYAADAWYWYENWQMHKPFSYHGELFNGTRGGDIVHFSTDYTFDQFDDEGDLCAIDCYWQSGSMSFGMDYQRKYSAMVWIGIKPETMGEVWVTLETDKNSVYQEKVVTSSLFGFDNVDFADFTFETNRKPQMHRLKIKAKKFVFYNLILESNGPDGSDGFGCGATVTSADMRVRFTGYSK